MRNDHPAVGAGILLILVALIAGTNDAHLLCGGAGVLLIIFGGIAKQMAVTTRTRQPQPKSLPQTRRIEKPATGMMERHVNATSIPKDSATSIPRETGRPLTSLPRDRNTFTVEELKRLSPDTPISIGSTKLGTVKDLEARK